MVPNYIYQIHSYIPHHEFKWDIAPPLCKCHTMIWWSWRQSILLLSTTQGALGEAPQWWSLPQCAPSGGASTTGGTLGEQWEHLGEVPPLGEHWGRLHYQVSNFTDKIWDWSSRVFLELTFSFLLQSLHQVGGETKDHQLVTGIHGVHIIVFISIRSIFSIMRFSGAQHEYTWTRWAVSTVTGIHYLNWMITDTFILRVNMMSCELQSCDIMLCSCSFICKVHNQGPASAT